jgi:VWFA-related protein
MRSVREFVILLFTSEHPMNAQHQRRKARNSISCANWICYLLPCLLAVGSTFALVAEGGEVPSYQETIPSSPISGVGQASDDSLPGAENTLHRSLNLVTLDVRVHHSNEALVARLTRAHFRLFEDEIEQSISYFSKDKPPLALVLLVDKSSIVPEYEPIVRQITGELLRSLKPGDRAAVCEFQRQTRCLNDLTANQAKILTALNGIEGHPANSANILDALYGATLYLRNAAAPQQRRAILLISNAGERFQSSAHSDKDVVRTAQEFNVQIQTIQVATFFGLATDHYSDSTATRKWNFSYQTGGEIYFFGKLNWNDRTVGPADKDVPGIDKVLDGIRDRVTLGYYAPASDRHGQYHRLRAMLLNDMGKPIYEGDDESEYVFVYRKGYRAGAQ